MLQLTLCWFIVTRAQEMFVTKRLVKGSSRRVDKDDESFCCYVHHSRPMEGGYLYSFDLYSCPPAEVCQNETLDSIET